MLIISTICKVDSKRYKFTDYDTILLVKQLAKTKDKIQVLIHTDGKPNHRGMHACSSIRE